MHKLLLTYLFTYFKLIRNFSCNPEHSPTIPSSEIPLSGTQCEMLLHSVTSCFKSCSIATKGPTDFYSYCFSSDNFSNYFI